MQKSNVPGGTRPENAGRPRKSAGGTRKVTVIVAAHKRYRMPEDPIYLPLHVGAEDKTDDAGRPLDLGYRKDNTGDNISELNPGFCELTGLYWAWKNLDSGYIGLAHYRRHFRGSGRGRHPERRTGEKETSLPGRLSQGGGEKDPFRRILTGRELRPMLDRYQVFVPKKRRYWVETLYSHYAHTHYAEHLDITREIIAERCPEYLPAFDRVMKQRWGYMFNMMILRRDLLDDYCSWLFDILFRLRERLPEGELSGYQGRLYGRVSELLFNVWLTYRKEHPQNGKKLRVRELPYIYMEKTDWIRKGTAFMKARIFGKRYEGSF